MAVTSGRYLSVSYDGLKLFDEGGRYVVGFTYPGFKPQSMHGDARQFAAVRSRS